MNETSDNTLTCDMDLSCFIHGLRTLVVAIPIPLRCMHSVQVRTITTHQVGANIMHLL